MKAEVIRLMSDYCCDLPLWKDNGNFASGDALGLSPGLTAKLRAWQVLFEEHFDPGGGWDNPANARVHASQAPELAALLRRELQWSYEVVIDLWPVTGNAPGA